MSDGGTLANSAFGQALHGGTLHLPPDHALPGADHRGPRPAVRGAMQGAEDSLQSLKGSFMAHFSAEGAVA
ncbi:hypothetical protein QQF64_023725 [Cirrhinus molitorella]|uniref:Uncharacterized protein n=1 Tax=Cirrhinus molitorella TaxID=172907 RepID=A0ABR3NJ61_9TELE